MYVHNDVPNHIHQDGLRLTPKLNSDRVQEPFEVERVRGLWHLVEEKLNLLHHLHRQELLDIYVEACRPITNFLE